MHGVLTKQNPLLSARPVSLLAPAKINLTLEVLSRRSDGFHELQSLVIGVGLSDRLTFTKRADCGISIRCNDSSLQNDDNLAYRAAQAYFAQAGVRSGVDIQLEKNVWVGAGLGGGSSDAASVLRACRELFKPEQSAQSLCDMGAAFGSDIPLFFHLPAAIISGRGEKVAPIALNWTGWVLLVHAREFVSTARVYGAWRPEDRRSNGLVDCERVRSFSRARDFDAVLVNELEPAIFRVAPEVEQVQRKLRELGLGEFRVSGAGSALFRLFDEEAEACDTADQIRSSHLDVDTVVTTGPTGADAPEFKE